MRCKRHIEALERRLNFLQNFKTVKNSFDIVEITALVYGIEALKIIFADLELRRRLAVAVKERKAKA